MSVDDELPVRNSPLFAEGLEVLDGSVPWLDPSRMPEKPGGFLYGVRFKNHPKFGNQDHPCGTEEELIQTLLQHSGHIDLVYLPDNSHGVPRLALNRYNPWQKPDLLKLFFRTLRTRGLVAVAAIGGALFMQTSHSLTLFLIGLIFGVIPVFDAMIQWLIYPKNQPVSELKKSMIHGSLFFDWIERTKRSKILIWLILGIIAIVYWGQMRAGVAGLENPGNIGVIQRDLVRQSGEWWRLFTGTLMHGPIWHIAMNGLGLFYIGKFIHRLTHPVMVPIVFVISAFAGAIASVLYAPQGGSVGASGGVVGMIGFLTWLVIVRRKELPYDFRSFAIRNIFLLAVLGVIGFFFVDNAGHAGGFIGGLFCGIIYQYFHRDAWDIPGTPVLTVLGALSGLVLLFGLASCLDLFLFDGTYLIERLPHYTW